MAVGIAIVAAIALLSVFAPAIAGDGPDRLIGAPLQAPSGEHWFGTDALGRDVFVRTFVAARVDYLVAIFGTLFSLIVGTTLGTLVAMARRPVWGKLLMRVTDGLIAVPFNLLILVIVLGFGTERDVLGLPKGLPGVLVAVIVVGWSIYARLARAEAMTLRQREFVGAARLMGFSKRRIVGRHILPTVILTTGTYAVADTVMVIGLLAGLPFLGAGVLPPTPEWGTMMFEGRGVLESAWWVVVFPAAALVATAIAISLIADGLLDRLGAGEEAGR